MNSGRAFSVVFTMETYRRFQSIGARHLALRSCARGASLSQGDSLSGYVVDGVGFVCVLTVTGPMSANEEDPVFPSDLFPCTVPVASEVMLPIGMAVPLPRLLDQLPRMKQSAERAPGSWGFFVRGSPRAWRPDEAAVVEEALIGIGG